MRLAIRLIITGLVAMGLMFAQAAKKAEVKAPAKAETKKAEVKKAAALIDINTATVAELRTIDGIGEAYSAAIVKGRPYRAKNELADKKIIPAGVYEKIKDKIIAKQAAGKK